MSPTPSPRTPANAGADLDALLRTWFDTLVAQPVPDAILRQVNALERPPAKPRRRA